MFRRAAPSQDELAAFEQDGYLAYPDVFTEEALAGLTDEVHGYAPVRDFLGLSDEARAKLDNPYGYFERPWNDRGFWGDRIIDDPFITALLKTTIGPDYHFCHSALHASLRGSKEIGFHQDHHHWFHENPVNLAERENLYIQILYYPNGFTRGDRNLKVIPGSHKVAPTGDLTPEKLLSGAYDEEAGRALAQKELELPPGSMVYLNARMFHGVSPKPMDSPQACRLFLIDIFKQAGPPHRYTQEIPSEWMDRAGEERKRLFRRAAYTPESWMG